MRLKTWRKLTWRKLTKGKKEHAEIVQGGTAGHAQSQAAGALARQLHGGPSVRTPMIHQSDIELTDNEKWKIEQKRRRTIKGQ